MKRFIQNHDHRSTDRRPNKPSVKASFAQNTEDPTTKTHYAKNKNIRGRRPKRRPSLWPPASFIMQRSNAEGKSAKTKLLSNKCNNDAMIPRHASSVEYLLAHVCANSRY